MNEYLGLLLEFQALPRTPRASTFMEVAGYPHYENVCSNILAFFFDPAAEHGLGDLLLRSFLTMAGHPEVTIPKGLKITREHAAEQDKRIDLVIDAETFTLGIENKIYHWEANDLENYARVIDALARGKPTAPIKAILCLRIRADEPAPKGGFIRYTYPQLWSHVQAMLGQRLQAAHPKWLLYLTDFMETTARLAGQTPEEAGLAEFFSKHHELVERLVSDRQQLLNRVANVVKNIRDHIVAREDVSKYQRSRGIWQTYTLANHFTIQGKRICIDLVGALSGWSLIMFQLDDHTRALVAVLRQSTPLLSLFPEIQTEKDCFVLQRWPLHAQEPELEEALVTALRALIEAADSLPND
jgi:hypothetical protein